jgi:hypothetical protein
MPKNIIFSFMKLVLYIMAPEPISMAYVINSFNKSVCLYVYPIIVAKQRLGKNPTTVTRQRLGKTITVAMNTHAMIEELLGLSFSVRSMTSQGK